MTSGPAHQLGQVRVAALKAVWMSRYFPDILPALDFYPGLHTYPSLPSGAKVLGLTHAKDSQPGSLAEPKNKVNETLLFQPRIWFPMFSSSAME